MWFQTDHNGVGELEYERYYIADNSIFLSSRKVKSEINAMIFVVVATNVFFLARFCFQHYVLKPLANSFSMRKQFKARFLENGWYSLYYLTFFCFGFYVYLQEPWSLIPTMNIWLGWPIQQFPTLYRTYYLLELSFYIHCMIALSFETRRKDFYQMFTHHIATFFLVAASYWYRYHRIGILILLLHNCSDIFLYSAKTVNYVTKDTKNKYFCYAGDLLFVCFAISFLFTRLMLFPFTLVKSTLFEAYYISVEYPLFFPANAALLTLLILHLFWFYLILRIVYAKLVKGFNFDDIRSDSEDEDGNPTKESALEAENNLRKRHAKKSTENSNLKSSNTNNNTTTTNNNNNIESSPQKSTRKKSKKQ